MLVRLGYVGYSLELGALPNRTCILRNATPERLLDLTRGNLVALEAVLRWNAAHGITLFRIVSDIVPFGGHPVNRVRWREECAPELARAAAVIRAHGMRVSMHPGQYTVLNSPSAAIVDAAIRDLQYHAALLDALQPDATGKIVIHVGGAYGDRTRAKRRFVEVASGLPRSILRRLVVENDDRIFAMSDVLPLARRLRIPVVFDWLHHKALPGEGDTRDLLRRAFATWKPGDGRPKVHLSSEARGKRPGSHADWVDLRDALAFLDVAPAPFDAMLEAKKKDRALLRLRKQLARAGVVEAELARDASPGRARTSLRERGT